MVLALAACIRRPERVFVVAHILHDLRPERESLADLEATRVLAGHVGMPFAHTRVRARLDRGNLEAGARRLRYRALARIANEHGCPYIATAHHADDQLESILLALLRGAGPRGLAGVAEVRPLGPGCRVIRPMLGVTHAEAQRICVEAGHVWQEDLTNAETARARGAMRHRVLPVLREIQPRAAARASNSAHLLSGAANVLTKLVTGLHVPGDRAMWPRTALRDQPDPVVGEALRLGARSLLGSARRDRLGSRQIGPAVRTIRSGGTEPRVFLWSGLRLIVTAQSVRMEVSG